MSKKQLKQTKINIVEEKTENVEKIETRENIVLTPSQFDLLMAKLDKLDEMNEKLKKLDNLNDKIDEYRDVDPVTKSKIEILLRLINDILVNIKQPKIIRLDDFLDIDRDDICDPVNDGVFDKHEADFLKYYTKTFLVLFNKKKMMNYHLSVMKKVCKDVGYEFISRDSKKKDSNGYTIYYSIIKRKK